MWSPLNDILAFIFPPFCPICKKPLVEGERLVCEVCFSSITPIAPPFCQTCGSPLRHTEGTQCARCRREGSPMRRGRGVGVYTGVTLELVHLLKYRRKPSVARRIGLMMGNLALSDPVMREADLLVPVPLHRTRLRERGYNQAELLAKSISERMSIPVSSKSLIRKRATKTQTLLGENERRENVRDAFQVVQEAAVKERKVILVDDVLTTGATIKAAASALLEAGAEEVYGLFAAIAQTGAPPRPS